MSKGSPSVPAAPDPTATAAAQTQSNLTTAEAQAALNNVNQVGPGGTVTYNQTGTGTGGVPTYTETTALSPQGQQIYNSEGQLVNAGLTAGQGLAQNIDTTPLNLNTADSSTLNSTPQQLDQNSANATYAQAKSYLDPQWNQQQQELQDQLSRQGIPLGSQAYNNSQTQFDNSKTQAYNAAQDSAIENGVNNAATLNNMAAQDQSLNVNQQVQAQDQPINLLSALLSGSQTGNLTTPPTSTPANTGIASTDVGSIVNSSYQNQLAAYQAQLAQQNSLWGGLASLGGNLGAAAILA